MVQNLGMINTLVLHAIRISDKDHLEHDIEHLYVVLKRNGYNEEQVFTLLVLCILNLVSKP